MQEPTLSKYTAPFGWSLAICAVLNAFIVIAKEKSKSVNGWMQRMTGHHWTTHVLIVVVLFLVLGFLFAQSNRSAETKTSGDGLVKIVIAGVVAGVLMIAGFYLIAD